MTVRCDYCGDEMFLSAPSYYGSPKEYACYCPRLGRRVTKTVGGGRYLGGGVYSASPDSDAPSTVYRDDAT